MDFDLAELRSGALYFIVTVVSLALHEWGHAMTADRLGDSTPRLQGRVTLNPAVHIDLLGTIVIPLLAAMGFFGGFTVIGWAKPVMVTPANFRRGHFDLAWVTLAGPGMNAAIALLATVVAAMLVRVDPKLHEFAIIILNVNVALFVFNLLPVPPLDGSKFLMYWFGMSEEAYIGFARWGGLLLLLLLNLSAFRHLLSGLFALGMLPFGFLYGLLVQ